MMVMERIYCILVSTVVSAGENGTNMKLPSGKRRVQGVLHFQVFRDSFSGAEHQQHLRKL